MPVGRVRAMNDSCIKRRRGHLCATMNYRYHSAGAADASAADASNIMILLPSVLRSQQFPSVLPLAARSGHTVRVVTVDLRGNGMTLGISYLIF